MSGLGISDCGSVVATEIPLSYGQTAVVDAKDADWLSGWKWSASACQVGRFVAVRNGEVKPGLFRTIYMAREILGLKYGDPLQADHINHDLLDNRRSNLRIVTGTQNKENQPSRGGTSRFVGVTYDRHRSLWRAQIQLSGEMINLGRFEEEEDAARARDDFVRTAGSAHALNFPDAA